MIQILSYLFLISYIFAFRNFRFTLFMYLVLLPLNNIFQREYLLLPISYVTGFAIILLFHFYTMTSKKKINLSVDNKKLLKVILFLLLILTFHSIQSAYKQYLFLPRITSFSFPRIIFSSLIHILALYKTALYFFRYPNQFYLLKSSIFISAFILTVSMPITGILANAGFDSLYESSHYANQVVYTMRYSGLSGIGDANAVGVILNFTIALLLFSGAFLNKRLYHYSLFFVLIIGVGLTGSRMAFASLVMILCAYLFFMRKKMIIPKYLIFLIITIASLFLIVIKTEIFDLVLSRIQTRGIRADIDPTMGGYKAIRWIQYLKYSFSSPHRFFLGCDSILMTSNRWRDVHNLFIKIFHYSGAIVLLLFVIYSIKMQLIVYKRSPYILVSTLFLPILIGFMIISSSTVIEYYILLLPFLIQKKNKFFVSS